MRVVALDLVDFLSHEKTHMVPGAVNLVMGLNGAGKTTLIRDSLSALRSGRARGLLAKDAVLLTRRGAKTWAVTAGIQAGGETTIIQRTASKCSVNAAGLDRIFGDPRVLSALLGVQGFAAMTPDERRAMVSDLVASDTGALVERLKGLSAPKDVVDAASVGDFRKAYRLATEHRRLVAATLKGASAAGAAAAVPEEPKVTWRGVETPVSQIPAKEISDADKRIGELLEAAVRAQADQAQHDRLQAEAERARAALAGLDSPAWTKEDGERETKTRDDLNALRREAGALSGRLQANIQQAKRAEADRASASKAGKCQACGQPLPVGAPPPEDFLKALGEEIARDTRRSNELASSLESLERAWADLSAAKSRALADAGRRAAMESSIRAAEASRPPQGPKESVESLRASRARLSEIVLKRASHEGAVKSAAASRASPARLEALRAELLAAEEIEAATDPSKAGGLAGALERIRAFLATHGHALFGKATKEILPPVTLTEGWEIVVEERPFSMCSTSEQDRAAVLLAAALADLSGLKLLVLDQLEHQDRDHRRDVLRLAKTLTEAGVLDQVWLGLVPAEGLPALQAAPPWLTMWWVDSGSVRQIGLPGTAAPASAPPA